MPHDHSHAPPTHVNRNFKIAIGLNICIVVLEVMFGLLAHSIALVADAGHNTADVLALVFAMGANLLAMRPPTSRRTYGFRRTTILAALLNAVIILVLTGAIMYGAIERFRSPTEVNGAIVSAIAAISIALNGISAWVLFAHQKTDLNVRAPFLHLIADAASAAAVMVAGLIIVWSGASWVDPLASILICLTILLATWSILRESFNLVTDAVPEQIDADAIESYLRSIDGVLDVHDLHIWGMSTTHVVLTVHLIIPDRAVEDDLLFGIARALHDRYGVEHTTIQVERGAISCELAASHVI
jgi:cobalt-zinc-cadmium efflux system protein